jgi:transposase InsO family protein
MQGVGVARSSHRYQGKELDDEEQFLIERMTELALPYGRYEYRRITAWLRNEGWEVSHKRIERLLRQEGLEVP